MDVFDPLLILHNIIDNNLISEVCNTISEFEICCIHVFCMDVLYIILLYTVLYSL